MFSLKERLLFWTKLGQTTTTPAATTTTTTQPGTNVLSSSTQPPPGFNAVSGPWAWLPEAYSPITVSYLSEILKMIHVALHNYSYGQFNLVKNQNNLGSLDQSAVGSGIGISIANLAKQIHKTFLNNSQRPMQKFSAAQINTWADSTIRAVNGLSNLASMDPKVMSQLGKGGSFYQTMVNYLTAIKNANPIQR